jgi:cytochrome P450
MGDLTFGEGLNMLDDGEYSPWVKTIFLGIKAGTFFIALKMVNPIIDYFITNVLFKSKRIRQKQREHWSYTTERVDCRLKRTADRPDLWGKIIQKSSGPDGLTLQEHYSDAALFMTAGTETTATALSGTTYQLLQNPSTMKKLKEEIRSAFSGSDDLHLEDLARQKYLMAVLQEGLRMYPPVPTILPRMVPAGGMMVDGDKFLPEGTWVGVHQLSTYRMEEHFKHANEFHPERWLGGPEFKDDHLDALEPFSVGPRNCLGKSKFANVNSVYLCSLANNPCSDLAWHEMRVLLATIILNFDIELCQESQNWKDQKVFLLWEKWPLYCKLTPVNKA